MQIEFRDVDTGDNGLLVVRPASGAVALCVTLEASFDAEVGFPPETARRLAEALLRAAEEIDGGCAEAAEASG